MLFVGRLTSFTHYFIIATSESSTQTKALAESLIEEVPQFCWGKEGFPDSSWVLLDYGDFVVHIFSPTARDFYKLERIWADAPFMKIEEKR